MSCDTCNASDTRDDDARDLLLADSVEQLAFSTEHLGLAVDLLKHANDVLGFQEGTSATDKSIARAMKAAADYVAARFEAMLEDEFDVMDEDDDDEDDTAGEAVNEPVAFEVTSGPLAAADNPVLPVD